MFGSFSLLMAHADFSLRLPLVIRSCKEFAKSAVPLKSPFDRALLRKTGILPKMYGKDISKCLSQDIVKKESCKIFFRFFRPNASKSLAKDTAHWKNGRFAAFSILTSSGIAFKCSAYKHALCESHVAKSRLVGLDRSECDSAKFDWHSFFVLFKPEILYIILATASALVVAFLNIQIASVLGDVVNVVTQFVKSSGVAASTFMAEIKGPAMNLIQMYIFQSIFTFVYISVLSNSGERVACRLRQQLFASIIKQDISFFDDHKTGEILSRLTSDVQDFKSSLKMCISQGLRSLTQTAGSVISLYFISPKMTGLMVVILPSLIIVGSAIGSGLRALSKAAQAQLARAAAVADEAIGNIRTVRAFAMEPKELQLYNEEVEEARLLQTRLGIGVGVFQGLTNLALNGIVLGVLFVGGSLLSSHEISPGSLMAFLVASQTIQRSLSQLSMLFGQFVRGMAAGSRVFQYTNLEPTTPLSGGTTLPKESVRGNVEFKGVNFTYPTRPNHVVLQDFNLNLPAGTMVAICGASGGGKSTVAALLERFYEIDHGAITLDGHDISKLDPSWLRGQVIGFISQEPVLFATSVMENIRYGRPDSTDQEVYDAARLANAHTFISKFPEGYQTILGERGVTVSGGQKQRIAIARALLKDPAILILDEATSALDSESEKAVQEALDTVVKGRTVLVIAHRLSTIQNADVIAVLANGKVVELGNHKSLTKKQGLYWALMRQQKEMESDKPIRLGA